jgi:type I restriction enzyme S subunit
VRDFEIPLPPLPKPQRIVAILDEAFDGIATARANAEQNLKNARELFESHLQSVFTQKGEGWVEKRLEDLCTIGDGNHSSNYPKKEEMVSEGVPFIRSTNLVDGHISAEDMRFLSPEKHAQLKKGHLKAGDVLFTNRGEIGKTAIVDPEFDGANLNSQIAWLRCGTEINNRFLLHVLNSGGMKAHFEISKNGAALQQFTIRQLNELAIPVPSKSEQDLIVKSADRLCTESQRLEAIYQQKITALDELKKALLHKAFSGEL